MGLLKVISVFLKVMVKVMVLVTLVILNAATPVTAIQSH